MKARCILVMALIAALALGAGAMTPGGIDKKYVGLFFDVFNTTPSNVLANADQFAEHAPYLDGVAIGLHDVLVQSDDGGVVTSQFYQIMSPTQRWTRDAVKDQLPYLKEIVKKPHLEESLLLFWMSPPRGHRIRWDDDKGWANFAENMATVAWLAKQAGMKGLMLDPEEYSAQGGQLAQYIQSHEDPPFPETAQLARQRGREVFSRVFEEFPDAVIFSLWCFKKFSYWLEGGRQPYPGNYADDSGELLQYFLNGMLDVLPPEARVVEGTEHYSGSALDNSYVNDLVLNATTVLPLVAPENVAKYRSQFYYGNTHYFDMYKMDANPKSHWYFGPVDGSRLEHMRLNFEQSLRVATKYVWLYGEGSGKLFNWRGGHYEKKKTWEEVAPGLTETIMMVKDPLGLAAQRKAALKKERRLVNLAADAKGFVLEPSPAEREFHQEEAKMPSAKGLKPGERYYVSVQVAERAAEQGTFRDGAAIPRVFWRKDGKRTSAKPVPMKVFRDRGRDKNGYVPAGLTVEVPANADELVCDLGASLRLGEHVCYLRMEVINLLDPVRPVRNDRQGKWTFDADKGTLTDGVWTLSAALDKKSGALTVRGADEQTVGSGVLDFSTVKADTGYSVARLLCFRNFQSLSALVAPDVTAAPGSLFKSTNVTAITVGDIAVPAVSTNTPTAIRLARLWHLSCSIKCPTGFRTTDHRHKMFAYPKKEVSVKGVKPGELYAVGLSMKRHGPGYVYINVRFRGDGKMVTPKERFPSIAMSEPRVKEDVWRSGEVVVRVPEGADEIFFDISTEIVEGHSRVEFRDFKVYKIGDPLPVWPPEALREKGSN
ncbi:MAG: hypothetical protein IJQ73_02990 [Kiritimatiellae bacterium]|nr:hypothetical protein [Kiritimatiellia bacterium]